MLKKLNITVTKPKGLVLQMLSQINGTLTDAEVITYKDGVYENPHYSSCNGEFWLQEMGIEVIDGCVDYGVADNYEQILEYYSSKVNDPKHNYVILLSEVRKDKQPSEHGWRWHKWGKYIGTQNPQYEYLYDEENIEKVYCYLICEVE